MGGGFTQTASFRRGREGEAAVARYLQKQGWFIVWTCDFSAGDTKAPELEGESDRYVLPDLCCYRGGERMWAEVKTRQESTIHKASRRVEHGFSFRHYQHYKRIEEITGTPVVVFVFEVDSGQLLFRRLRNLTPNMRVYEGSAMDRGGTAFFLRDDFRRAGWSRE